MGAEYMIRLAPGEAKKVNAWQKTLGPDDLVMKVTEKGREYVSDVWIDPCKGNKLEIGYSFGGNENGELAIAIGFELMQRVKATRWGWDSVGWLKLEEMAKYGVPRAFRSQIEMRKGTIKRLGCVGEALEYWTKDIEHLTKQQALMETWAAQLLERTWPPK